MPYFIYRIHRYGGLERLEDLPTFAAASQRAKSLRADPGHDAGSRVKVVFRTDKGQIANAGIYILYFEVFNPESGFRTIKKLPLVVSFR